VRLRACFTALATDAIVVDAAGRFIVLVCELYDLVCLWVGFRRDTPKRRVVTPDPSSVACCHLLGSTTPPASKRRGIPLDSCDSGVGAIVAFISAPQTTDTEYTSLNASTDELVCNLNYSLNHTPLPSVAKNNPLTPPPPKQSLGYSEVQRSNTENKEDDAYPLPVPSELKPRGHSRSPCSLQRALSSLPSGGLGYSPPRRCRLWSPSLSLSLPPNPHPPTTTIAIALVVDVDVDVDVVVVAVAVAPTSVVPLFSHHPKSRRLSKRCPLPLATRHRPRHMLSPSSPLSSPPNPSPFSVAVRRDVDSPSCRVQTTPRIAAAVRPNQSSVHAEPRCTHDLATRRQSLLPSDSPDDVHC